MTEALKPVLAQLAEGATPSGGELKIAFDLVMEGHASAAQIGAFLALIGSHLQNPHVLAAGAHALRARMTPVSAPADAMDVCGTGGDGSHTLNISTAVAFVVAGAGVPVAKHGNRAMSSRSGAADVLEALGVTLTGDRATLERCLAEARVAFLFAQNHHPAMRHVAGPRRELGFRTIFNLLGPLANPANVKRQLVGVFAPHFVTPVAHALRLLGAERALVVHGAGGLDELACAGGNVLAELSSGSVGVLPDSTARLGAFLPDQIRGGDATENAAALRALLHGRSSGSAYEAFVLLNAAAAFMVSGRAGAIDEGVDLARASLLGGDARRALETLVKISGEAP